MNDTDKMRQAFEAWLRHNKYSTLRLADGPHYASGSTQFAWKAWQSSAQQAFPVPSYDDIEIAIEDLTAGCTKSALGAAKHGVNLGIRWLIAWQQSKLTKE